MICRQIDKKIIPVGNFRRPNFQESNYPERLHKYCGRSRVIRGWKEGGADWREGCGEEGREGGARAKPGNQLVYYIKMQCPFVCVSVCTPPPPHFFDTTV